MVVLLDHIDVNVVINGMTRCLTSMTTEGEQSNNIARAMAADNNDNIVRDMDATAVARDIAGSVSHD